MEGFAAENTRIAPPPYTPPPPPPPPPSPPPDVSEILDSYHDGVIEEEDAFLAAKGKTLSLDTRIPPRKPVPNRAATVALEQMPVNDGLASSPIATPSPETASSSKSFWKNAVDETVYFAGGLASHPFESNKHFSILRHSSGLIYYKGPSTRVIISVFSDAPLPPDRSLWLQRKGFSGHLGMNTSALLGTTGNWIDVTPATEALVTELPEQDERAWQRDIKKFYKKASKDKHLSKQSVRETFVIRVPAQAQDGYLRIVMCTGGDRKKKLCPSPVFRIASTSTDVSILRGASLRTIPLEAGLKAASIVGSNVVNAYVGPVKALVVDRVQQYTSQIYQPTMLATTAEVVAYDKSGLQGRVEAAQQRMEEAREAAYNPLHAMSDFDAELPPEVVGKDTGPEEPFPIKLDGKVVRGTGQGQQDVGIPTANLSGVSSELMLRLNGIYIGWAAVQPGKGLPDGISNDWHEAIVTIGPSPYAAPRVVQKNVTTVHIIHDFGPGVSFFDAKLRVIIMAFLRPMPSPLKEKSKSDHQELTAAVAKDISVAVASLSREEWGPEMSLQRQKTARNARGIQEKYVDARSQVQTQVDRVPMHWAGVRTRGGELRDKALGNGGFWIKR